MSKYLVLPFFLTLFFITPVAYAQVCNPGCGSGQVCIYQGDKTTCVASSKTSGNTTTVSEFVVTAPKTSGTGSGVSFASFVNLIVQIVNRTVIPTLFAFAFLFFMAGVARYVFLERGSEEGREKGKKMMLYGIIGLVVLFAVWGIVNFFVSLLASLGGVSATQSGV